MSGLTVAVVGLEREARIVGARAVVARRGLGIDEALRQGGAAVISFGLCGALDPSLNVGDLVIGEAVVDGRHRFTCDAQWSLALNGALPRARRGLVWADGRMVTSVDRKAELHGQAGAMTVDMESHTAAGAAADFGVPFAVVRAVSDDAMTAIPAAAVAGFRSDGTLDPARVAWELVRGRLGELADLIGAARDAGRAFKSLEAAASAVFQVRP